jgi:hypothetical protein
MDCPNCRLVNPPDAERCDCGYDFPTATRKEPYTNNDPSLSGVGGWLLFFCISLTILDPLYSVIQAIGDPRISQNGLAIVMILCIAGFSIYTGFLLWKVRPDALKVLKGYFIFLFALACIGILGSFAVSFTTDTLTAIESLATQAARLVSVAIWALYFKKSRRVRNTFGRNLF